MKLIDSNILIYAAQLEHSNLRAILQGPDVAISNITRLEVLGYHKITDEQVKFFTAIFRLVKIIDVDNNIINKAIEVRQLKKVTVGDSIIAATAILNSAELITRNVEDFKPIPSINIVNPFEK